MEDFKIIEGYKHISYTTESFSEEETVKRSEAFFKKVDGRRSVRDFSNTPIPREVIDNLIKSASTAPSGAHKQPWTFCVIQNPEIKKQIRIAAEKEERESYEGRMNEEWVKDLKPLGTDWRKPFLETAPYLIIVFKKPFDFDKNGNKKQNYYVTESVGLACGFLINAIHNAGLVTLTHTPSPMKFLSEILDRPINERPFLLLPIGYPANEVYVPDIKRKSLEEVAAYY